MAPAVAVPVNWSCARSVDVGEVAPLVGVRGAKSSTVAVTPRSFGVG